MRSFQNPLKFVPTNNCSPKVHNYSIDSPLLIGRRSSGSILMGLGGDGESGDFLTVKQKRLRPAVSHAVWL